MRAYSLRRFVARVGTAVTATLGFSGIPEIRAWIAHDPISARPRPLEAGHYEGGAPRIHREKYSKPASSFFGKRFPWEIDRGCL